MSSRIFRSCAYLATARSKTATLSVTATVHFIGGPVPAARRGASCPFTSIHSRARQRRRRAWRARYAGMIYARRRAPSTSDRDGSAPSRGTSRTSPPPSSYLTPNPAQAKSEYGDTPIADRRSWRGVLGRSGVNLPRLIHALRTQAKREKLTIAGRERGAIVWAGDVAAP